MLFFCRVGSQIRNFGWPVAPSFHPPTTKTPKMKGLRRNTPFLRLIAQKSQLDWCRRLAYLERCRRRKVYGRLWNLLYFIPAFYAVLFMIFTAFMLRKPLYGIASATLIWIHGLIIQIVLAWSAWDALSIISGFFMDQCALWFHNSMLLTRKPFRKSDNVSLAIDGCSITVPSKMKAHGGSMQIFVQGTFKTQILGTFHWL